MLNKSPSLRMGQWAVVQNDGTLRTLLGSCIGLALYDPTHHVAGLAHVVLPRSPGKTCEPGRFVDTAVPVLLSEMAQLVGRKVWPTARIVGGANMFASDFVPTIGQQNIEASEQVLGEAGIPIVGRHCGGEKGRRMTVSSKNGLVTIEVVGQDPIELIDERARSRGRRG
jgi:chemotaxis protein CheD